MKEQYINIAYAILGRSQKALFCLDNKKGKDLKRLLWKIGDCISSLEEVFAEVYEMECMVEAYNVVLRGAYREGIQQLLTSAELFISYLEEGYFVYYVVGEDGEGLFEVRNGKFVVSSFKTSEEAQKYSREHTKY